MEPTLAEASQSSVSIVHRMGRMPSPAMTLLTRSLIAPYGGRMHGPAVPTAAAMALFVAISWVRIAVSERPVKFGWLHVWLAMACPPLAIACIVEVRPLIELPTTKNVALAPWRFRTSRIELV